MASHFSLLAQRIPLVKPSGPGNSSQDDTNRPESPMIRKPSSDKLQSVSTPSFSGFYSKRQESFEVQYILGI